MGSISGIENEVKRRGLEEGKTTCLYSSPLLWSYVGQTRCSHKHLLSPFGEMSCAGKLFPGFLRVSAGAARRSVNIGARKGKVWDRKSFRQLANIH